MGAAVFIVCLINQAQSTSAADWIDRWLAAQTNLTTWEANVTQVRELKSLTQPLKTEGHVWFSAPNLFRWEMGKPARTIALRQPQQMLVIYPRLKRAERYPIEEGKSNPWKETLALLESGFPRSRSDLESRFQMKSERLTNDVFELTMEPKSVAARRLMPQLKIAFSTNDLILRFTELQFADGSKMKNLFSNAKSNPELKEDLFAPTLDSSIKVTAPLSR